ncbi:hypothetical protein GCM10007147_15180 [Nocardiopsis kunsanensis]|uniref:Uncharacterized protein n=1 Tax=Nocardiopsis kunsanensis TaxID=141693 RepID=A0A918XB76_9ACTN|nr:hypothetical protein GCM10007147_15180 [Nocardiopsis kunsanensis]
MRSGQKHSEDAPYPGSHVEAGFTSDGTRIPGVFPVQGWLPQERSADRGSSGRNLSAPHEQTWGPIERRTRISAPNTHRFPTPLVSASDAPQEEPARTHHQARTPARVRVRTPREPSAAGPCSGEPDGGSGGPEQRSHEHIRPPRKTQNKERHKNTRNPNHRAPPMIVPRFGGAWRGDGMHAKMALFQLN